MGFFNKQNEDLSEQWRKRYLNLFDTQKQLEHEYSEREKFFRQFVIQLSILCEGNDKNLDLILRKLREFFKKREVDSDDLKAELKLFNDAVKNLPKQKERLNADLLFDFLIREYPDANQQNALRELKKFLDGEENTIYQPIDLFIEILKIIAPEKTEPELELKTSDMATIDDIIDIQPIHMDVSKIITKLYEYLSTIAIPEVFEPHAATLKTLLSNSNEQTTETIEQGLQDLVEFLLKVKEYTENEQQDVDQFLLYITSQLSDVNALSTQADKTILHSVKTRNKLDQFIFTQVRDLQVEAIQMSSLDTLKELVNQCFKTIASEIKTYHQNEKERQQQFHDDMSELVNKMIELEVETERLKTELKVVHSQNLFDPLTNLPNRNAYNRQLKNEIARFNRYQMPLSLVIFDVDNFAAINESFGYKFGDKILALIAQHLQQYTRDTDFIARFGGEEFAMLLSNTDKDSALIVAEQLREGIATASFSSHGKFVNVTVSSGLTEFNENDKEESFFERAEQALRDAKKSGRNQSVVL